MVCSFLLYNKVNQLYIYIYPRISSLLRLPPSRGCGLTDQCASPVFLCLEVGSSFHVDLNNLMITVFDMDEFNEL